MKAVIRMLLAVVWPALLLMTVLSFQYAEALRIDPAVAQVTGAPRGSVWDIIWTALFTAWIFVTLLGVREIRQIRTETRSSSRDAAVMR